ncbi:MAG TPA: glycosyltransferase [Methylomirabilota bacterium]|nr:glycosyltransferase [Methylomirabilota bacterium]
MTGRVSFVIPTFDGEATLPLVLDALARQTAGRDFEVVVVDDGSRDATPRVLEAYSAPYRLRVLRQPNQGPAAARNQGVREARGQLIVFLGDDTVPEPEFLTQHLTAHAQHPDGRVAVLGYTTWPAGWRVTPFLFQINEYGLQFGYRLIADPENVPFNFFYTSNVSLARSLLLEAGLFDTDLPHAAWEDAELAYRLSRLGMRLVYRPGAVTRHHHLMTFEGFRGRQRKAAEAATIVFRKHPELAAVLGVPRARQLSSVAAPWERAMESWARLATRWRLPGGRAAIQQVMAREYYRALGRALKSDGSPGR